MPRIAVMVGPEWFRDEPMCGLILSALTVSATSFADRVRSAASAGYSAIGLRPNDYHRAREAGASDADLRALLAEHGIEVAEHQALREWAYTDERAARSRDSEEEIWAIASALGGRYVIATAGEGMGEIASVAAKLAELGDRAATHGLVVALEFMPWADLGDAVAAWEVVELAAHPAVGILVDSWHLFRGSGDLEALRSVPAEQIVAVHLADADAQPVGSLREDTVHRRRVPGAGSFALIDFVRTLDDLGVRVPFAVEVLSDELRALPAAEAARVSADGARSVIAAARALPEPVQAGRA